MRQVTVSVLLDQTLQSCPAVVMFDSCCSSCFNMFIYSPSPGYGSPSKPFSFIWNHLDGISCRGKGLHCNYIAYQIPQRLKHPWLAGTTPGNSSMINSQRQKPTFHIFGDIPMYIQYIYIYYVYNIYIYIILFIIIPYLSISL